MSMSNGGWENNFRKANNANAEALFQQQYLDTISNLSRMGLDNSGFRTSQLNPAYQTLGANQVQGEAEIDKARQQWEQLELMKKQLEMQGKKTGLGKLMGSGLGMGLGALLAIPTGGLSVAAGAGLGSMLGGTAGGIYDYSKW